MKKILGLDLGTNSIGGSFISIPNSIDDFGKEGKIEWLGSRIIPVEGDYLQKFESGAQAETKAASRRMKRGSRRLKHRYKLRRSRLIAVFKMLGWVDESFPDDFKKKMANDENYKFHIGDYLSFGEDTIEEATELLGVKGKRNKFGNIVIPEDWIIYYLRKKALTEKITVQELARIIYMMNQRRGFKSSRKDLKDDSVVEVKKAYELVIRSVELKSDEKNKKGQYTFVITPTISEVEPWDENMYKKPEWEGKKNKYVVTWRNGKQLKPQKATNDDWEAVVVALDNEMEQRQQHPGEFFFDELIKDKNYKIRQFPILRKRYKAELDAIWEKQLEERIKDNTEQELLNENKIELIAKTLYKHNTAKQKELIENGLLHIFSNDIIYYQRELKSQKHSIGECQYEKHTGIDGEIYGVKSAPKSCPEFQEYRIWQDIHNIRIFEKEQNINSFAKIDVDVTNDLITEEVKEKLFELFDTSKEVSEKDIFDVINSFYNNKKLSKELYKINLYANREKLLGNETKELFRKLFGKFDFQSEGEKYLADKTSLRMLWHIIYSISSSDSDKSSKGIKTALQKFNFPPEIVEASIKLPELKKQYAAYSTKALNKLLPLMRCGKYWEWENISEETKKRIKSIIKDGWDFAYDKRTGELIKERGFLSIEQFSNLPAWMACYVVYGRHSEKENTKAYNEDDIKTLDVMRLIPNNSLRNPLVEQVIRETLFLVKDVCKKFGQPDEIHIELGRELKKNSEEKFKISERQNINTKENERIKKLLYELMNGFDEYDNEGNVYHTSFRVKPNPESPRDIEKFRIWKDNADVNKSVRVSKKIGDKSVNFIVNKDVEFDNLYSDGKKERIPTKTEIKKYALWLSQNCTSPYTGNIIPLSKLFDKTLYEVEHIIPQSKLKYDSIDNLVISEAAINPSPYKGNMLARNFIKHFSGQVFKINNIQYKILTNEEYENHCKDTFKGKKLKNLLATEVPEDFVERQINDTRYITRKVSELLYPFVKTKENEKNDSGLVFTIGSITSDLKREWGLNTVWKDIIKPRFKRLEEITGHQIIFSDEEDNNKFHFNVPEQPEINEKRIDHRHHALDALIIAATTREHIRYLNSLNAVDSNEELLKVKRALVKGKIREFKLPWINFTKEAKEKLEGTIVTFKSKKSPIDQIISKPTNKYVKWFQKSDGSWEKREVYQKPNKRWMAVRKSMFKEPQGIIWLKEKKEVSVREAFKIHIERMKVEQDSDLRKTTSYVYDQAARKYINDIINKIGIDLENTEHILAEVDKYLKKNCKKVETGKIKKKGNVEYKTIYQLGDFEYEKIWIAEFVEYAAKRVKLDNSFTHDKIDKIPYSYAEEGKINIAKLLHQHLEEYEKDENKKASEAFVGEGIETLAKKAGKRIDKVTIYEKKSSDDKFGNKFVEVDKGAVAYFIIYENLGTKERTEMFSLATHKAIEKLVQGKPLAERKEGFKTIILSPNDLVYVPTEDEMKRIKNNDLTPIDWNNKKNINARTYKMVKSTGRQCFFIPAYISKLIIQYDASVKCGEIESQNCSENTFEDEVQIKKRCIKLEVDRLGNIKPAV